jgi:hypothetical protein
LLIRKRGDGRSEPLLVATAPSPADLPVVQSSKVELVIYQPDAGFYVNATQLPWSRSYK